jgi:hypothetical protein
MAAIRKGDDHDLAESAGEDLEQLPGEHTATADEEAIEQAKLLKASKIAKIMTVVLTLSLLVLWPMPMYGSGYIFSKKFFTGWVVVGIIWLFGSLLCVGVFPVWEGRNDLFAVFKSIYLDVTGKKHPSKYHGPEATFVEGKETGTDTPPAGAEEISEKKTAKATET